MPTSDDRPELTLASMTAHLDDDDAALTFALGRVVRASALLEYSIHTLRAHLLNVEQPYVENPRGIASRDIETCEEQIDVKQQQGTITPHDARAVTHDLGLVSKALEDRNLYVHGFWYRDDETGLWVVVKGEMLPEEERAKGAKGEPFPAVAPDLDADPTMSIEYVWRLAAELYRLAMKLAAWDAHWFPHPRAEGYSVKRW